MWISKDDNSFNFVAPSGATDQENEVNFPFVGQETVAAAATIAVEGKFAEDVKDLGILVGDTTINATVNAQLKDGAKLILKVQDSGGAGDVVTFGTAFLAPAKTLTTDKTYLLTFMLIGGVYTLISEAKLD